MANADRMTGLIHLLFVVVMCVLMALASLPWIFDWSNTIEPWVFGVPFASFWQILLSCLAIAAMAVYYHIERIRGTLDLDVAE